MLRNLIIVDFKTLFFNHLANSIQYFNAIQNGYIFIYLLLKFKLIVEIVSYKRKMGIRSLKKYKADYKTKGIFLMKGTS